MDNQDETEARERMKIRKNGPRGSEPLRLHPWFLGGSGFKEGHWGVNTPNIAKEVRAMPHL